MGAAAPGGVPPVPNALANARSPYLLQHQDNPVEWREWSDETLALAQAGGQADPALGRLRRLPLVPRHGARELREPGGRGGDEPRLRQRQGRPRGAAGHRRHLPARAGADGRAGRLAAHHVPDARGRAFLGRYLLPARAALRPAGLPAGAGADRGALAAGPRAHRPEPGPARGGPEAARHARGRRAARRGLRRARRPRDRRARRRGPRRASAARPSSRRRPCSS